MNWSLRVRVLTVVTFYIISQLLRFLGDSIGGTRHTRLRVCGRSKKSTIEDYLARQNLALRWRADGNEPTVTSITLMAAHPVYIGKSMEVGSGSSPLCGLENRRPKGYAGSSPVPSASFNNLPGFINNKRRPFGASH